MSVNAKWFVPLTCLLSLCAAATASAQSGSTELPDADARTESSSPEKASTGGDEVHWYGWQILLTAGPSNVLAWIGARPDPGTNDPSSFGLLAVGVSGVIFGGPIVHAAHGNFGKAVGSLGLNVAIPLALGGLGMLTCFAVGCAEGLTDTDKDLALVLAISVGVGGLGAPILDALWLAYEPLAPDHTALRRTKPALVLVPRVVVERDGSTSIALRGAF